MKLTLNVTHRCNLNCTYCYAGRKRHQDMPLTIAEKSIALALAITSPETPLEFSFFGGEPLLCFDLIKAITDLIHEQSDQRKQPVRISMTTNGTLLTHSTLSWLKQNQIDLCVSVDGPEPIHDVNRRFSNGEGSFARVSANLSSAIDMLPRLQVNAVYGPKTLSAMAEALDFFIRKHIPVVHFNPDICADWHATGVSRIDAAYQNLAQIYLNAFREGTEVGVNLLDSKMILFMKGGYTPEDVCGMGKTELAVSAAGNIYPCERFVGDDDNPDFRIGHVSQGFDSKRRCAILKDRGNSDPACSQCNLQPYCMNWCGCTNYYMTGQINHTGAMLCASEKAAIQAARSVFTKLVKEENETFVDHLYNYAREGCGLM